MPCTLFGHQFQSRNKRAVLFYTQPLCDWSATNRRLQLHEGSHRSQTKASFDGLHKYTSEALTKLLSDFDGNSQPVDVMIDKQRAKKIQENRAKLHPIIETVIFLGRNGLPFRGH